MGRPGQHGGGTAAAPPPAAAGGAGGFQHFLPPPAPFREEGRFPGDPLISRKPADPKAAEQNKNDPLAYRVLQFPGGTIAQFDNWDYAAPGAANNVVWCDGAPKGRITGSFDYPAIALDKDAEAKGGGDEKEGDDDEEAEKKDGDDDEEADDKAAEGAPSREECEKALAHAVDLMLSDPQMTVEMRTAVKEQLATGDGKKSADEAIAKCLKAPDRKEVACMMAATDLPGLSKCAPQGDAP